jgi:hypothetical protein
MNSILISHRGNLNGKIVERENHPDYIDEAINLGYDVEIDIWVVDGYIFLGHDYPDYKIDIGWLTDRLDKLWIHCKNIEAILYCRKNVLPEIYDDDVSKCLGICSDQIQSYGEKIK